jgi:hypothetical protein
MIMYLVCFCTLFLLLHNLRIQFHTSICWWRVSADIACHDKDFPFKAKTQFTVLISSSKSGIYKLMKLQNENHLSELYNKTIKLSL